MFKISRGIKGPRAAGIGGTPPAARNCISLNNRKYRNRFFGRAARSGKSFSPRGPVLKEKKAPRGSFHGYRITWAPLSEISFCTCFACSMNSPRRARVEPSSGRATEKTRARATPFSSFQDGSWGMLLLIEKEASDCTKYHAGSKAPGRLA